MTDTLPTCQPPSRALNKSDITRGHLNTSAILFYRLPGTRNKRSLLLRDDFADGKEVLTIARPKRLPVTLTEEA